MVFRIGQYLDIIFELNQNPLNRESGQFAVSSHSYLELTSESLKLCRYLPRNELSCLSATSACVFLCFGVGG